jgi:hypothetical protein
MNMLDRKSFPHFL